MAVSHKERISSVYSSSFAIHDTKEDHILETPIVPDKTIVVMPLDSSEHSLYVMQYYIKYLHRPVNKVYACYVSETLTRSGTKPSSEQIAKEGCCNKLKRTWFDKVVVDVGPSPGVLLELQKAEKMNYHKIRHRVKHMFRNNNIEYEFHKLTGTDPGDVIISFRKEVGATLIVMGSRGLGGIKRRVFGSVSDKVLKNCLVPVIIVKKPTGASAELGNPGSDTHIM